MDFAALPGEDRVSRGVCDPVRGVLVIGTRDMREQRGSGRMLHTMAALSSGLRCASGSGGIWPCPRVSNPPGFTPILFSSSEGEWPLSLSTRAVEEVMLNLGSCESEWWRLEREGLEQAREQGHDGLLRCRFLICTVRIVRAGL